MKMMQVDLTGSSELSEQEMKMVVGGKVAPAWWAVLWDAISNFGDIREGFGDGINNRPPRY